MGYLVITLHFKTLVNKAFRGLLQHLIVGCRGSGSRVFGETHLKSEETDLIFEMVDERANWIENVHLV